MSRTSYRAILPAVLCAALAAAPAFAAGGDTDPSYTGGSGGPGSSGGSSDHVPPKFRVSVPSAQLKTLARTGHLRVRIHSSEAAFAIVFGKLRAHGIHGASQLFVPAGVPFRGAATNTGVLKLSSAGRKALSKLVHRKAPKPKKGHKRVKLKAPKRDGRADRRRCGCVAQQGLVRSVGASGEVATLKPSNRNSTNGRAPCGLSLFVLSAPGVRSSREQTGGSGRFGRLVCGRRARHARAAENHRRIAACRVMGRGDT